MQQYLDRFGELYPQIGFQEDQALNFFLTGLVDKLQMLVRMFKSQTLSEACSLAKLHEITVAALKEQPKPITRTPQVIYASKSC